VIPARAVSLLATLPHPSPNHSPFTCARPQPRTCVQVRYDARIGAGRDTGAAWYHRQSHSPQRRRRGHPGPVAGPGACPSPRSACGWRCMLACMKVSVCVHMCVFVQSYTRVCLSVCALVCMRVRASSFLGSHVRVRVSGVLVHVHVPVVAVMYVCVYVCVCVSECVQDVSYVVMCARVYVGACTCTCACACACLCSRERVGLCACFCEGVCASLLADCCLLLAVLPFFCSLLTCMSVCPQPFVCRCQTGRAAPACGTT